ncbi:MAG: hypothetical protein IPI52_12175 [Bacteroidetes bacterium]|nr:hypothetical protein [Bacteroidota bacterium]
MITLLKRLSHWLPNIVLPIMLGYVATTYCSMNAWCKPPGGVGTALVQL